MEESRIKFLRSRGWRMCSWTTWVDPITKERLAEAEAYLKAMIRSDRIIPRLKRMPPSGTLQIGKTAHWERRYRKHVLWSDYHQKPVAVIQLGSIDNWDGVYRWRFFFWRNIAMDRETLTLAEAKAQVERELKTIQIKEYGKRNK